MSEALEILADLANALEAAAVNVKRQIAELGKIKEPLWNPSRIIWQEATGEKGVYHKTVDFENPQYKEMLRDLNKHAGTLYRDGLFYWSFPDGKTVGRKPK